MAGPRQSLKDTENYQMVSGLDENEDAQELTFLGDRVKTSTTIVDATTGTPVEINSSGQLHIVAEGVLSVGNSNIAGTLSAGETFTGTSISTLAYSVIVVSVYSDVASATDGLIIEQSMDDTNWDHSDEFTIPAQAGRTFNIKPKATYLRVRYTNGGSDQTVFRLSTIVKKVLIPSDGDIQVYGGVKSASVNIANKEVYHVHVDAENITGVTGVMIVDLSDTTNWPHTNTGHIVLQHIVVGVNPNTSYVGDIDFGFLSNVDATNGDFNIIGTIHMDRAAASTQAPFDFSVFGLALDSNAWFGPTVANDTTWQTDVNLLGPDGTTSFPAGDGDFVMKINHSAGAIDVGVTLTYITR